MEPILDEAETACLKALAKRFEEGRIVWTGNDDFADIGLSEINSNRVLKTLESEGYIIKVGHTLHQHFSYFHISPVAAQAAR